jgi:hypothetical protein
MTRIIRVTSCRQPCPYFSHESDIGRGCMEWDWCNKYKKEVVGGRMIMEFCQLEMVNDD